ncbi:hypothetical protein Q8G35_08655 [Peribacillus simplex]|uniref:Uncharacterized protein n=2 Tax=Peribacillus TaxID=2675229 RepID=A0AA90PG08_9BACI|nr:MULTISPECIES: hypothetical protein [Peribacillus]MDP1418482.1 hypothetical protein [Peribacillus simplex]MDP1451540.1 hypothetical protein [Peribacillus frigoritolerans]
MTTATSKQAIVMGNVEKSAMEMKGQVEKLNRTPAFTLTFYSRKPDLVSCFFAGKKDGHPLSFHNFVTQ